jgi:hypothetical protein
MIAGAPMSRKGAWSERRKSGGAMGGKSATNVLSSGAGLLHLGFEPAAEGGMLADGGKADEVADGRRLENALDCGDRGPLAAGGIGEEAEHLEADHTDEGFLLGVEGRLVETDMLYGALQADLLEVEKTQADRAAEGAAVKDAREFEQGGGSGAVVVGPGGLGDGIKVSAEDEDLGGKVRAADLDDDVVPGARGEFVGGFGG